MTRSTAVVLFSALFALTGCPSDNDLTLIVPDVDDPVDLEDTGLDVPDPDAPVAVCSVNQNPIQPPFETAVFDGSASYDPNGGEITSYDWVLVQAPPGNTAQLLTPTQPTTTFQPQLAGTYSVELTVQNNFGVRSTPCRIDLEATPSEDLWVEMFWSHSGEDMDLHLLAPGGTPRSDRDCYFANCAGFFGLDWGQIGNPDDDPALDLDDIPGTGPENINISDPEAGEFTVFVHDYPGSVRQDPTEVTVNIYLGGVQVFSETRRITGEDQDEYFALVNPSTGTVTPL